MFFSFYSEMGRWAWRLRGGEDIGDTKVLQQESGDLVSLLDLYVRLLPAHHSQRFGQPGRPITRELARLRLHKEVAHAPASREAKRSLFVW